MPIAIQAFTNETLEQLNVATFSDFIKYLPNVTAPSAGPGQSQIFSGNVSTTLLRFENPAYSQYDASLGVAKDAWTTELYAQNLTNVIASMFTSTTQFVPAQTITRPRVLGLKFGFKF